MGLGLIDLTAMVIVAIYFEKKRAFAAGIASSGSDIGTLIMAPLLNLLDNNFGWSYTFMMMGAFMLVCVPLGLLFKPISDKSPESERSTATCFSVKTDEETFCTRFCSFCIRTQVLKFPEILYDAVFTICLFSNFLANVAFPIAYSYTMVSMAICCHFLLFIRVIKHDSPIVSGSV